MMENLRDSRMENELIMCRCILIHIYKGEYEVRGKIYSEFLKKGLQKSSTRLSNKVVVRQGIKNKCHHHIKEPRTFFKPEQGMF